LKLTKYHVIALALIGAIIAGLIGVETGRRLQSPQERFVQVNAYGQWRGFQVAGDQVQWVMSCGTGKKEHWKAKEDIGLGLQYFTRESPLLYSHPSLGDFAKVDAFDKPQIDMAFANMSTLMRRWSAEKSEGERLGGCIDGIPSGRSLT